MDVTSSLRTQSSLELAARSSKLLILRAKRLSQWATHPRAFPVAEHASGSRDSLLHEIVVDAEGVQSHERLEAGKLRNLRIAAAHFDGRLLTSERGFSFWRLLGRPTRGRGFLPGTEIRDGCVVPTIGGGLCLLSSALFRLAAELDWTIHERHGHTIAPDNMDRIDATVFWPFVDLRFAPRTGSAVLRVRLVDGQLRVAAYGEEPRSKGLLRVWRKSLADSPQGERRSLVLRGKHDSGAEQLGRDRQRVAPKGFQRNCLTCKEDQCLARKSLLGAL